jgi:hypothetical protein
MDMLMDSSEAEVKEEPVFNEPKFKLAIESFKSIFSSNKQPSRNKDATTGKRYRQQSKPKK